ncbi:MAG: hypothetical protein IJP65_07640 [Bacteroidales bacterium]|nr:hypothetical protein [Bacteroidales bacterium]
MKKIIILALVIICCTVAFAQNSKSGLPGLKGMNVGVGIPVECYDIKAAGFNLHLGGDFTYPISDKFAMGFYISGGGGFLGTFKPYNEYDKFSPVIKLSAGLLMEFGDLNDRPFIVGVGPCAGLGYVDMDLVLPLEFRFGRHLSNNWYIMGELVYGVSLAKETRCFEPAIRVGYNFGHKAKKK